MPERYTLSLSKRELENATDMLRYDCAFNAIIQGDNWRIETVQFTPERWRSFMANPKILLKTKISNREETQLLEQSRGFTEGLRFATRFFNDRQDRYGSCIYRHTLVEGT